MNPSDLVLLTADGELKNLDKDENYLIEINEHNSEVVERLIQEDPDYDLDGPKGRFLELYAHQMSEEECFEIVKDIAIENNTRTADRFSRLFAKYMANPENHFFERVCSGEPELVDEMLSYVVANKGRKDKSLASKICKYLNEWICEGNAYSINDQFVRDVLPYYLGKHNVQWRKKNINNMSYVEFIGLFSKLEEAVGVLDKNHIDHILWYGYKSDPIRCAIAKKLGSLY